MTLRGRIWARCIACLIALRAGDVEAQAARPVRTELQWEREKGADACIEGDALQRLVDEQLGYESWVESGADLMVEGRVAPRDGQTGFEANVDFRDRDGTHRGHRQVSVSSDDCHAMDEALALVIAMTLRAQPMIPLVAPPQPEPAPEPLPPEPEPEPPPSEPEQTPPPTAKARLTKARGARLFRQPHLAVSALGSYGFMPATAVGAQLLLGIRPVDWLALRVTGNLLPHGKQPTNLGDVSFVGGYAEVLACPGLLRGRVRLELCGGILGGGLHAHGEGFSVDNRSETMPLGGATASGVVSVELGARLFLVGSIGAQLPFTRDRFAVRAPDDSVVQVHRLSVVLGVAQLGLGVQL